MKIYNIKIATKMPVRGKLLGRKKLLDPLLSTTEGTKITSTVIFYTSHALTVYSCGQCFPLAENAELLKSKSSENTSLSTNKSLMSAPPIFVISGILYYLTY